VIELNRPALRVVLADSGEMSITGPVVGVTFDATDARWLAFVALPTLLANLPSDQPEKVQENDQIEGQLAIGVDDG
jgi:hypothetical protein